MPKHHDMRRQKGWGKVISPDIRVRHLIVDGKEKSRHLLKPGQWIQAETTPSIIGHENHMPQISARSVLARHGVEFDFDQGQMREILSGKLPTRVNVRHSGEIPVRLREGNRTHRVYYHQVPLSMRPEEVRARMHAGDLQLGKDFKILKSGMLELTVPPIRWEVDPKDIPSISKKNWASGSKRKAFMEHFRRREKRVRVRNGVIVLTETLPVKLPKDIGLLLQGSTDGKSRHIHSLFIDPGFTGPIVLELLGINGGGKAPEKIIARLVHIPS